jgi:N-ethylmaleimide reductase
LPVAPSALPVQGEVYTPQGKKSIPTPRALDLSELAGVVEQYRRGAENAKKGGFDGVELHGANGYLLDQFLRDGANKRTDKYGGDIQNRARLPLEVTKAVIDVWGPKRVGYKISPHFSNLSMSDRNPRQTFLYLAKELSKIKLGYLHLVEFVSDTFAPPPEARLASAIRQTFKGTLILNGGYDAQSANQVIESGSADLVSFGSLFLANPDLPERFRRGAQLNVPDRATFYVGEEKGYIDYRSL